MGQTYAVNLTTKSVVAPLLVELTNQYIEKNSTNRKHDYTNWKEAIKSILNGDATDIKVKPDGIEIDACFDASYGYHSFMTEWFEAVASAFVDGTEFWVYPDEGASRQVIQNGKVSYEDLGWDGLVDYDPYLKRIYDRITEEVKDLDENQSFEIKNFLGEYGDEDCCVEEQLGEDTYAELTEEQCEQIINIIKEERKNQKEN